MILDINILYVGTVESKIYLYLLKRASIKVKKVIFLRYKNYDSFIKEREAYSSSLAREILALNDIDFDKLHKIEPKDIAIESDTISISSLDDKNLRRYLQEHRCKNFLYTGGGKVGKNILSIKNIKVFHIHPGVLPDIKGADCFLWSYLLRSKIGYSCFLMNEGIDTGDILYSREFSPKDIQTLYNKEYTLQYLYKGILHYYDSAKRMEVFIDMLRGVNYDINALKAKKQNFLEGRTYFFMHEKLKSRTLQKLFGVFDV